MLATLKKLSLLGTICLLLLLGCAAQEATHTPAPQLSVGVALGRGGLGDRSFNDSAYAGLQQAQQELGIRYRVMELTSDDTQATTLKLLVSEQYDLIIALGQEYVAALTEVAAANPDQRFAILDAVVDAPNVTSVTFRELEGDFLAGALSALLSPGGTVGFLGGADIPVIRRIESGWQQGVRYINPDATILSEYAGGVNDFSGFTKPELGRELALKLYAQADVLYAAAGRTALGAIDAAKEARLPIITTGSDQRWIAPDVVVTSRTKNMDTAVLLILRDLVAGTFTPGVRELDLKSGGVGMAELDSPLVTQAMRERLKSIEQDLISGKLVIKE